jgi:hypothetical protein
MSMEPNRPVHEDVSATLFFASFVAVIFALPQMSPGPIALSAICLLAGILWPVGAAIRQRATRGAAPPERREEAPRERPELRLIALD